MSGIPSTQPRTNAGGSADLVFGQNLSGSAGSFTLPNALAGGLTLTPGNPYVVDLKAVVLRGPPGGPMNPNTAAASQSYFDFTPLTSGVPVNLPTYNPTTHNFTYSMSVQPGVEVFIDPQVAEGYDYRIGAGNPDFQSVELPTGVGDGLYDLYTFDSRGNPVLKVHDFAGGTVFDFGPGGVDAFRVLGIEDSALIDPTNVTAFVTGLTFSGAGEFSGTQTPLVIDLPVPEPPGLAVLALGLVSLGIGKWGRLGSSRLPRDRLRRQALVLDGLTVGADAQVSTARLVLAMGCARPPARLRTLANATLPSDGDDG
jgi:hypothetical protein